MKDQKCALKGKELKRVCKNCNQKYDNKCYANEYAPKGIPVKNTDSFVDCKAYEAWTLKLRIVLWWKNLILKFRKGHQ